MSEEERNQDLSTDELKDVVGGGMGELRSDHFKRNNLADEAKWANRLTTKGKFNKGRKGKYTDKGATCNDY